MRSPNGPPPPGGPVSKEMAPCEDTGPGRALWHGYCSHLFQSSRMCWSCIPTRLFAGELRSRASLRVYRLLGLQTQDFERVVKALLGVLNENAAYLFHYLDFRPPLRSCHWYDPFVRRCVHAELFSCLNRASRRSRDFGDHASIALDFSLIQERFVTPNNS